MVEVVLNGQNGRELRLRRLAQRDVEQLWSYEATLSLPSGHATIEVVDHGDRLGSFLREVADAWQGFGDAKEYSSLEGQLRLSLTHDGRGTVACVVTLGQPSPPEWHIEGVLQLGAGSHLESIATDVESFVAGSA